MDVFAFIADRFVYPGHNRVCQGTTYNVGGVQCYIRHGAGSDRVIVYVHGNETTLEDLRKGGILDVIALDCNATVVAPEFPGYGDMYTSNRGVGHVADTKISDAVSDVVCALSENGVDDISLVGRSIGCALALKSITTSVKVEKLVSNVTLVSPFTSLQSMFPPMVHCLAQNRLDNSVAITNVRCPVLILHGSDDTLIPLDHAETLASLNTHVTLNVVDGMQHVINSAIVSKLCTRMRPFVHAGTNSIGLAPLTGFDVFKPE